MSGDTAKRTRLRRRRARRSRCPRRCPLAGDHSDDPFNLLSQWGVEDCNPSVNLLSAIGANEDASLGWLSDNGLQHRDPRSDEVFASAVETVAQEGEVHYDQLIPVLGAGARTHIDLLAASTDPTVARPGDTGPADLLFQAHDFLEVLMKDDQAAMSVYDGAADFVLGQVAGDTNQTRL